MNPHPSPPPTPPAPTRSSARGALLSLRGVSLSFGGIQALREVSFDVPEGSICGLIGPNGAGKTSLFNCLSRLYTCTAGEIDFHGQHITQAPAHSVSAMGIGRTFQNLALFRTLSVLDNLKVGRHCRTTSGFFSNALLTPRVRAERVATERRARELIEFLDLGAVAEARVSELPFGTQKRVELGRALAGDPRLLLLDEPACGLNHEEAQRLADMIRQIRNELRVTVLLVEHHMELVMGVSDLVVALNFGRLIAQGTPQEVATHPEVVAAYLGTGKS
jgi:branched-chain amino acid transport system ATP-binding protein